MARSKLHDVTKDDSTPDVHYLDNSPNAAETVDNPNSAEKARKEGIAEGQRTRTSTARFSEKDLKDAITYPLADGEEVRTGTHD